jgi:carbamoyltransferase
MIILGLSGGTLIGNQDPAAAIFVDGRLVAAAEEERFTGVKFANGSLPRQAIAYCLSAAGLTMSAVDLVAAPGVTYRDFADILERFLKFQFGCAPRIRLFDHHLAHAASAHYASGWESSLTVTFDFSGEGRSTTVRHFRGDDSELLHAQTKPDSLGVFYSIVTQRLGFQKDSDEYKVMGMAAYGQPRVDLSALIEMLPNGYRVRPEHVPRLQPGAPAPSKQEPIFEDSGLTLPRRLPGAPFAQDHYDLAASAQAALEDAASRLVAYWIRQAGERRVCLAGGVAQNSLMNQKIRELEGVTALFVPPACSDAGLAVGAAYLAVREEGLMPTPMEHAYWGPEYHPEEIRRILVGTGVRFREVIDPAASAVDALERGEIIGWFQGRMEFGPRALGHRSILANPLRPGVKEQINRAVKQREDFRPLAPAIPDDLGEEFYEGYVYSPFMNQTFGARPGAQERLGAAVHADGTSRLQSVTSESEPLFCRLLNISGERLGTPALINTSLNSHGAPLVCAPYQALQTYFSTGLDSLFIGPFALAKDPRE